MIILTRRLRQRRPSLIPTKRRKRSSKKKSYLQLRKIQTKRAKWKSSSRSHREELSRVYTQSLIFEPTGSMK
jgi:hypothetical protein